MSITVRPFLMFTGRAEEAMSFYVSLFSDGEILELQRWGAGEIGGVEGKLKKASFRVAGQTVLCFDSGVSHAFGFTPSVSLFVSCETEAQVDELFTALSADGQVLMPLGEYGFGRRFAWVNDRFGVSWQLIRP